MTIEFKNLKWKLDNFKEFTYFCENFLNIKDNEIGVSSRRPTKTGVAFDVYHKKGVTFNITNTNYDSFFRISATIFNRDLDFDVSFFCEFDLDFMTEGTSYEYQKDLYLQELENAQFNMKVLFESYFSEFEYEMP
jgi:hypothetical protein